MEKLKATRVPMVKEKLKKRAIVILKQKQRFEDQRVQIAAQKSNVDRVSFRILNPNTNTKKITATKPPRRKSNNVVNSQSNDNSKPSYIQDVANDKISQHPSKDQDFSSIPAKCMFDDKCEITHKKSKEITSATGTKERMTPVIDEEKLKMKLEQCDEKENQFENQTVKQDQMKTSTKDIYGDRYEIAQSKSKKVISTVGMEGSLTPSRMEEDLQINQEQYDEEENQFEEQAIKQQQTKCCLLGLPCFW